MFALQRAQPHRQRNSQHCSGVLPPTLQHRTRSGGVLGVRDPSQLEEVLYRPQTGYHATLIDEAAAMWESLAQNHPFIEGNKSTAVSVTYTFLVINGAEMQADPDETYNFITSLYEADSFSFDHLAIWLRRAVATPGERVCS